MSEIISYRIDNTKIISALENFPVEIFITGSGISTVMFNSLFTNDTFKPTEFKVVNPINDSELYTEISYYNYNTKEMLIHVKVPYVYSDVYTYVNVIPTSSGVNSHVSVTGESVLTTITGDTFTGSDGDPPDPSLWDTSDYTIMGNKLHFYHDGTVGHYPSCYSTFIMRGDFEIEVGFEIDPNHNNNSASFRLDLFDLVNNKSFGVGRLNSPSSGYRGWYRDNVNIAYQAFPYAWGRFKIKRVGSVWTMQTAYFDSAFVVYGTDSTGFTTDCNVRLYAGMPVAYAAGSIYFDNFNIISGTTLINPSNSVWDSDFNAVYHMAQDPSGGVGCILDSTSNNNHGTPNGNMTSGDLVDGLVGKAIDFDGSDDYIALPDNGYFIPQQMTLEVTAKVRTSSDYARLFDRYKATDSPRNGYALHFPTTGVAAEFCDSSGQLAGSDGSVFKNTEIFYNFVGRYDSNYIKLFVDGVEKGSSTVSGDISHVVTQEPRIGDGVSDPNLNGVIEEVRLSKTPRSDSWIKATSYSLKNNLVEVVYPMTCEGTVKNSVEVGLYNIGVNLYRRSDGSLVGKTTTTTSGTFSIGSLYVEDHFIVALNPDNEFNALIFDYISPTVSGS